MAGKLMSGTVGEGWSLTATFACASIAARVQGINSCQTRDRREGSTVVWVGETATLGNQG